MQKHREYRPPSHLGSPIGSPTKGAGTQECKEHSPMFPLVILSNRTHWIGRIYTYEFQPSFPLPVSTIKTKIFIHFTCLLSIQDGRGSIIWAMRCLPMSILLFPWVGGSLCLRIRWQLWLAHHFPPTCLRVGTTGQL